MLVNVVRLACAATPVEVDISVTPPKTVVWVWPLEVIKDVVEELGREVAYSNRLLLRGHGDRCQIDAL